MLRVPVEGVKIIHHGACVGVTGSCHEIKIGNYGILVDCGLFQGEESGGPLDIEFPINHIQALLLTHCHIDHVGRLPWLLAAGFRGPIYATEATAALLPMMLEDGLKILLGLNRSQCERFTGIVKSLVKPIPYDCRVQLVLPEGDRMSLIFRPAGHILGSAYIELQLPDGKSVVFSGDLGPSGTPLLVDPISPESADILVLESTYGDRCHSAISQREDQLAEIIKRSLTDGGAILIPAFSVGRTQELLFDLENIITRALASGLNSADPCFNWQQLPVILDSPLAIEITQQYQTLQWLWAREAKLRLNLGRHPLSFQQCITINQHSDHMALVNRLKATGEPAIVVAASGMCTGGRIMNYLEALLPDARTDVIFAGYQSKGTPGRRLLSQPECLEINSKPVKVAAKVHAMSGYSAHADQADLLKFVAGIKQGPELIRIVHGDVKAQRSLARELFRVKPSCEVIVAADEMNEQF
ncbi:Metallo-beta-lactamase family protein, RNA-specific [Photobacterium marinum]|uniref:Metallo-beta-lactamase family protein, RNA-specific n=1 Tax=Photobacterium marinum TaxID=1056511 RepID=L8J4W0_9GAMM|nr:MBL fold metallo-hydrolase [Photobacterium marinum]ELR63761.1 Metallo-beta-lactamase family protein, RNA-specific [Photobacterium marinum]